MDIFSKTNEIRKLTQKNPKNTLKTLKGIEEILYTNTINEDNLIVPNFGDLKTIEKIFDTETIEIENDSKTKKSVFADSYDLFNSIVDENL